MKIRIHKDKLLVLVFGLVMISLIIVNSAVILGTIFGIDAERISLLSKVLIGIVFLGSMGYVLKGFTKELIAFPIVIAIFFILNFVVVRESNYLIEYISTFISTIFPMLIVLLTVDKYEILVKNMIRASYAAALITLVVFAVSFTRRSSASYSMAFSNALMLPECFLFLDFMKRKKFRALILAGAMTVIGVILGSRGSAIGILVLLLVELLKRDEWHGKWKAVKYLFIFAILTIILFFNVILTNAYTFLLSKGLFSRSIAQMIMDPTYLSGRDWIWKDVWNAFLSDPLSFHGVSADCFIVGVYTHNFVIELLYEGGLVLGGLCIIYIVRKSVSTIKLDFDSPINELAIIFFCISVPKLLFSDTIWTSPYFWCWLVMCFRIKNRAPKYDYIIRKQ